MNKIDGKGHHPKVRPYCRRCDKDLKEVRISVCSSLSAWQLAMRRLGICFTASEKNGIGTPSFAGLSLCEAMEQASSATQSVGVGCADAGGWYVDTSGCGMLQYDDANPPPKNEFTHSVLKVLAILLSLVLVVVASSCNKTPEPTPNPEPTPTDTIPPVTPNDTIPPVTPNDTIVPTPGIDTIPPAPGGDTLQPGTYDTIPGRTVILRVDHPSGYGLRFPTMDTVRYYANHPGCDTIFIKWYVPLNYTVQWTPGVFHVAFDSLEQRFNLTDKCCGARDIVVSELYGGASIPDEELLTHSKYGMTVSDSIRCTNWGYHTKRAQRMKVVQPPRYNGNRVPRAGRSH